MRIKRSAEAAVNYQSNSTLRGARAFVAGVCAFLLCVAAANVAAAQDDETTRGLWDTAFLQKRPAGKAAGKRQRQVRYRSVAAPKGGAAPPAAKSAGADGAVVGLTVWRLRRSGATDEVRQLVREEPGEWTPERVGADAPLREGQRVQITIEAPRDGYLYVFDREMLADKSLGEPYLIFPTTTIRGGDNKVTAGRVIEIPSSEDKPPYYTLKRSRPDYEGELLTVIITDEPLAELAVGRGSIKLPAEQVESYEKKWGAAVDNLELIGGAGTAMTKTEKIAAEGKQLLTQSDSPPQTIFRVRSKPGNPLLFSVRLSVE